MKINIELSSYELRTGITSGTLVPFLTAIGGDEPDGLHLDIKTAVATEKIEVVPYKETVAPSQVPVPSEPIPAPEENITRADLQKACIALVDKGGKEKLSAMLDELSLQSIVNLPDDQIGSFYSRVMEAVNA